MLWTVRNCGWRAQPAMVFRAGAAVPSGRPSLDRRSEAVTLRQPFLHDLAVVLRAPTQVWSAPNGDVDGSGVQGAFFGDHRVLRGLGVDVQDAEGAVELASAGASLRPDGSVDFHTVVR